MFKFNCFYFIFLIWLGIFEVNKALSQDPVEVSNKKWQEIEIKKENKLIWTYPDNESQNEILRKKNFFNPSYSKKESKITAVGKSVKIDGTLYPEISSYVPNGFIEDEEKFLTLSVRGFSATRGCNASFKLSCSDAIIFGDINLFRNFNSSLNMNWAMQSLSNRNGGTKFGEGQTLGLKYAFKLNNKWSLSFGGDNIILFDDKSDLGRNLYLIAGTYFPVNDSYVFFNAGIGSDFFGYRGNGYIARTKCLGKPNLTGEGENTCTWGPISSIAIAFNERLALVNEWFGYGYGSGISYRPFIDSSLNLSIYITDYFGNFPVYIKKSCRDKACKPRIFANMSISF